MIDADGRVIVSPSTLRRTTTCTTLDVAAQQWTGIDDTGQRTCGVYWHEVVAEYFKTGRPGAGLAKLDAYREFSDRVCVPETWTEDGVTKAKLNRCRYANVIEVAQAWMLAHPIEGFAYRINPALVEVAYLLPLGGRYWTRGRLDAIVEDDGLWVLDNKTSGRLDANFWRQWRMDDGLTEYVWAAQQTLGESIRGVIVEGVQMSEVPKSSRKCGGSTGHGVPYSECGHMHIKWGMERFERSAQQVEEWRQQQVGFAERHFVNLQNTENINLPQEGKHNGLCYRHGNGFAKCDFVEWCEAGRPRDFEPSLLGLERVKAH